MVHVLGRRCHPVPPTRRTSCRKFVRLATKKTENQNFQGSPVPPWQRPWRGGKSHVDPPEVSMRSSARTGFQCSGRRVAMAARSRGCRKDGPSRPSPHCAQGRRGQHHHGTRMMFSVGGGGGAGAGAMRGCLATGCWCASSQAFVREGKRRARGCFRRESGRLKPQT